MSDEELFNRFKDGDMDSFEPLYYRYRVKLYVYILSIVVIRHDADEIERMFAHSAPTGRPTTDRILLRVFVHFHGQKRILLLSGYDKGRDPTDRRQHREMAAFRRLLAQFKRRRRRANRT